MIISQGAGKKSPALWRLNMVPNMTHGLMIEGFGGAKKPWGACGPMALCESVHRELGPPYPPPHLRQCQVSVSLPCRLVAWFLSRGFSASGRRVSRPQNLPEKPVSNTQPPVPAILLSPATSKLFHIWRRLVLVLGTQSGGEGNITNVGSPHFTPSSEKSPLFPRQKVLYRLAYLYLLRTRLGTLPVTTRHRLTDSLRVIGFYRIVHLLLPLTGQFTALQENKLSFGKQIVKQMILVCRNASDFCPVEIWSTSIL